MSLRFRNIELRQKREQCAELKRLCDNMFENARNIVDFNNAENCKSQIRDADCLKYLKGGKRKMRRTKIKKIKRSKRSKSKLKVKKKKV